jgi:6-phosphofructokinase
MMGVHSIEALMYGESNKMVAMVNNTLKLVPFSEAISKRSEIDSDMKRIARVISI